MDRYQDLAFEIKRIHRASKVTVIPIGTVALGTISKNAKSWHEKLKMPDIVGSAQLSANPWNSSHIAESAVFLSCGK